MKKFALLIVAIVLSGTVFAQKYVPKMGIGTVLNYNIIAANLGQQIPLTLTSISLNDPMKFKWSVGGFGSGTFLIPVKALESGTKMSIKVPENDQATVYKDDETILFISKASFNDLVKNQSFVLNKTKFNAKPLDTPFLINTKEADVLHAVSDNGKVELWVLNNPDFPILCKMTGSPAGFDFTLTGFRE